MISRERILQAAAEVYAQHGFRGATTRRIAESAGVNEITLFRQFGSKEALIGEVLRVHGGPEGVVPPLPETPSNPRAELTEWCTSHLEFLRARRSFIRKTMSEMEERPEAGPCATRPNMSAGVDLKRYIRGLHVGGFVPGDCKSAEAMSLAHAAGAMLMAALFGDAMGRDVMPDLYPEPAGGAAALYVLLFLRALGVPVTDARDAAPTPTRGRGRSTAASAKPHHPSTSNARK